MKNSSNKKIFSKQFESAIKALKAGKDFNYSSLQVPPGFAKIPLNSDGRPVLTSSVSSSSLAAPARPTARRASPQPQETKAVSEEADDDLLAQLENEIDSDDDDEDDAPLDPEEEKFNQQIRAAQKFIPKMDLPPKDDFQEEKVPKKKAKPTVEIAQFPQVIDQQLQIPQIPQPRPQVAKPVITQNTKSNSQGYNIVHCLY